METGGPADIRLNGQPHPVPPGTTVAALLAALGMDGIPVLVEHNGTALFPREFAATVLHPGDRVELIRITAGG